MRIKRRQFNEFVAGNFLMAILKPQFQAPPGEQQGNGGISANKVRSGRFTGRYQLTGELLVLKDTQDSVSGYIAFGTTMATMPTTASSGTGMYLDYTGIYGLASGTKQFYLQASDGKAYAAGGNVILDTNGVFIVSEASATSPLPRSSLNFGTALGTVNAYLGAAANGTTDYLTLVQAASAQSKSMALYNETTNSSRTADILLSAVNSSASPKTVTLKISSGAHALTITGLPTSSAGLSTGDVWSNAGVLTIV